MTVNEAIEIYNNSPYQGKTFSKYAKVKDGIVLITEAKGINYYGGFILVTDDKKVIPTDPVYSDIDDEDVMDL